MKHKILQFALMGFASVMLFACEKKVEVTTAAEPVDKVKTEIQAMEDTYAIRPPRKK
ncbi:MAG TPA: hypothetical protein VK623_04920 [Flavobacterium sp.]|nr:hypothetical protein [Flavobacterium sp.]